jgi:hypothetical protein
MYNLLVSSHADAWSGEPWQVEFSRCVREYTENAITERLGELNDAAVSELKRLPCIFAYEAFNKLAPKFGKPTRTGSDRIRASTGQSVSVRG